MKDSLSNSQIELEQRKQVYESAKKVRKHAKAAYEAEVKALKAHLKSFKQMYKHAVAAEKDAKKAYKALQKGLDNFEQEISMIEELVNEELTSSSAIIGKEENKESNKPKQKKEQKKATKTAATPKKKSKPKTVKGGDDLTKVKGVGDIVADMLKANGITTYADMAATSFERYKELLKANGMSKFRNPSTWAAQAATLAEAPVEQPKKAAPKAAKAPAKPKPAKKGKTKAVKGGDDLTMVKGVGDIVADMLKANGITTYADMASTSFERYKELLKANGMSKFRNPSTWAAQAATLAEAPVEQPKKAASKAAKAPAKPKPAKKGKTKAVKGGDDLTKVKGVGDIVADMLKANGITTYADMAATSFERYKELLKANGMSKFRNPSTWAAQAATLDEASVEQPKKAAATSSGPEVKKKVAANDLVATPKVKQMPAPVSKKSSGANDDLSKIKGIGDKVIEVLNKNGIKSYADVAATSVERFNEILEANKMSRFRDPSGWAEQAAALMKAG